MTSTYHASRGWDSSTALTEGLRDFRIFNSSYIASGPCSIVYRGRSGMVIMRRGAECPFCKSTHFIVDLYVNDDYEPGDEELNKWSLSLSCAQASSR